MSDRVAIITGAAGGLGHALTRRLGADGMAVVGVDITDGADLQFDLSTSEGNAAMVAGTLERFGRIDVLILNAGVQHVARIPSLAPAEWDRLMRVMATGPFLALQAAWEALTARAGGRVVAVASTSSFIAEPGKAAYVAAKHAILGLVRSAALEAGPEGMTVNAVAPAWMLTPLVTAQISDRARERACSEEEVIAEMLSRQPVARFIDTEEVAAVVSFLVSADASAVNGACIPVGPGGACELALVAVSGLGRPGSVRLSISP